MNTKARIQNHLAKITPQQEYKNMNTKYELYQHYIPNNIFLTHINYTHDISYMRAHMRTRACVHAHVYIYISIYLYLYIYIYIYISIYIYICRYTRYRLVDMAEGHERRRHDCPHTSWISTITCAYVWPCSHTDKCMNTCVHMS